MMARGVNTLSFYGPVDLVLKKCMLSFNLGKVRSSKGPRWDSITFVFAPAGVRNTF